MKKKIFDIKFDPTDQPGFQTRNISLDGLLGPRIQSSKEKAQGKPKTYNDGRNRFKSMQVPELLPSVKLRKKGLL